jgi:hypothetical protein
MAWYAQSIIAQHGTKAFGAQPQDLARNDASTVISFYETLPQGDIAISDFEEWAIARLRGMFNSSTMLPVGSQARSKPALVCSPERHRILEKSREKGR